MATKSVEQLIVWQKGYEYVLNDTNYMNYTDYISYFNYFSEIGRAHV